MGNCRRRRADRVLLYLHGGGYSIGSIHSHRDLVARLCLASKAPVFAIDYRLAPEHRFPAQLEDSLTAYRWLLGRGLDAGRIVIAGESAGGGLTLSTLLALRDHGDPLPAGGVCLSPWTDLENTGASMTTNASCDYVRGAELDIYARRFVTSRDLRNPLAAPTHADFSGLPPLLIQAGGAEALLDDARHTAARAREAGVEVELDVWEDMPHAWHLFAVMLPEARAAIERVAEFITRKSADS